MIQTKGGAQVDHISSENDSWITNSVKELIRGDGAGGYDYEDEDRQGGGTVHEAEREEAGDVQAEK
jgi:hypothetical protein